MANPLMKATELTLAGPDEARISQASAFASHGEGGRLVSEAAMAEELVERYPPG